MTSLGLIETLNNVQKIQCETNNANLAQVVLAQASKLFFLRFGLTSQYLILGSRRKEISDNKKLRLIEEISHAHGTSD